MALVQSTYNPFRDPSISQSSSPLQTPANTGSSAGPLNPTNTGASTIPEEAPPAYTPRPNVRQGEESLERGPARPFQQNTSNGSRSSYPGQRPSNAGPPPLPPRNEPPRNEPLPSPMSAFAKDFYAIGGDVNVSGTGSSSEIPDDGRPTTKPVPGHPLLNKGKLLVYPRGHNCEKCKNTGYKQNDPSHPCRKCWSKFGKPYTGALTYLSFRDSSMGDQTLQKPLPKLRPPQSQFRPSPQPSFAPPPGPPPQSGFTPPPGPPPPPSGNMPGSWCEGRGSFRGFGGSSHPNIQQIAPWAPRPQNGPVYRPGDPRIGGRLCWRCDGDGCISVFIFETDTCPVCSGIGRLF